MRRSAIWLIIAVFWLGIAGVSSFSRDWRQASLQAVVSLIFFFVYFKFRRKESIR